MGYGAVRRTAGPRPQSVDRALCDAQHIGSIDGEEPELAHQDIPPSIAHLVWRRDGGRCRVDGCRSSRGLELHHVIHRADGGGHDPSNIVSLCSACHLAHHRGALTITGTANQLQIRRPGESAATGARDDAGEIAGLPAHDAHVGAGSRSQAAMAEVDAHAAADDALTITDPGAMISPAPIDDAGARARGARRLDAAIFRTQAKAALTGLGWKPAIAHAAVAAAAEAQGEDMTLERLIFEALRRCPAPKA